MKTFVIVLLCLLTIYISANVYIGISFKKILTTALSKQCLTVTIIFLASAFFLGRIFESKLPYVVSHFLIWCGSVWMGVMVYLFFTFLVSDIVMKIIKGTGLTPENVGVSFSSIHQPLIIISVIVSLLLSAKGIYNAHSPDITHLTLNIAKQAGNRSSVKLVVLSDLHLGHMMKNSQLQKIVETVNSCQPDIILFPGDIIDEDVKPVIEKNLGNELVKLNAPLGVYAVTGNHEYIGGVNQAVKFLEDHGITLIRDTAILIDNAFYIAGREDRSSRRFKKSFRRKPLESVLKGVDKTLPVILLDHQPMDLKEAQQQSVDLQLSGHTHNGQLFPFNAITAMIFEKSWGYLKKGNTHYYVSCGAGTWGPPMKIGSKSEIVEIILNFETVPVN